MTDRDRLIELFEAVEKDPAITCPHYKTDKTCDTCKYTINNVMCNHTLRTVDYLLANGVIVPPCKVGDIIYAKYSGTIEYYVIDKVIHNGSNSFDFEAHLENEDGYEIDFIEFGTVEIGRTVFLTEEEAEQALKEREGK